MADISRWVSVDEQSLRRLREKRTVLGFAITHEGDEPRLAITVPFPTDERTLGFDAWRVQMAQKQIRAALPQSIPFQIVGRQDRDEMMVYPRSLRGDISVILNPMVRDGLIAGSRTNLYDGKPPEEVVITVTAPELDDVDGI